MYSNLFSVLKIFSDFKDGDMVADLDVSFVHHECRHGDILRELGTTSCRGNVKPP